MLFKQGKDFKGLAVPVVVRNFRVVIYVGTV